MTPYDTNAIPDPSSVKCSPPRLNTKDNVARYYRPMKEKIRFGYRGVSYANFGASDELNQGECNERRPHAIKVVATRAGPDRLGRVSEKSYPLTKVPRHRPLCGSMKLDADLRDIGDRLE
jgi:hypothetical protein